MVTGLHLNRHELCSGKIGVLCGTLAVHLMDQGTRRHPRLEEGQNEGDSNDENPNHLLPARFYRTSGPTGTPVYGIGG